MAVTQEILEQVEMLRKLFKEGDEKRDAGLDPHPSDIERIDNLSYGSDPTWHLLDLYLPKKRPNKIPTIINIHGGGWVYGNKEVYQFFGLSMAQAGFAFVNFNYRLAPEVTFPAELDDVNQAVHWVAKHANQYGLDKENIFFIGDSAGGQMTMQYLTILTNPDYRALFGYEKPDLSVRAAAIHCGASFIMIPGCIEGAPQAYFTDEILQTQVEKLQVENYMTSALPPLFLTTANQDFIRDCTIRLNGYLLGKGIDHEFHSYGGPENPKGHVFNYNLRDPEALRCNQATIAFFKKHLS